MEALTTKQLGAYATTEPVARMAVRWALYDWVASLAGVDGPDGLALWLKTSQRSERERVLDHALSRLDFLDPCCGDGALLSMTFSEGARLLENAGLSTPGRLERLLGRLCGVDVDKDAIVRCKGRLEEEAVARGAADAFATRIYSGNALYHEARPLYDPESTGPSPLLTPFSWGAHYQPVFGRGGFSVIVANPPWEVFRPNPREFFQAYEDMTGLSSAAFATRKAHLLEKPSIRKRYGEYEAAYKALAASYRERAKRDAPPSGAAIPPNLYILFARLALELAAPHARVVLILPAGFMNDLSCYALRRDILAEDRLVWLASTHNYGTFENVADRVRYVVLGLVRKEGPTETFRYGSGGLNSLAWFPETGGLALSVAELRALYPDTQSLPDIRTPEDLDVLRRLGSHPPAGAFLRRKTGPKPRP